MVILFYALICLTFTLVFRIFLRGFLKGKKVFLSIAQAIVVLVFTLAIFILFRLVAGSTSEIAIIEHLKRPLLPVLGGLSFMSFLFSFAYILNVLILTLERRRLYRFVYLSVSFVLVITLLFSQFLALFYVLLPTILFVIIASLKLAGLWPLFYALVPLLSSLMVLPGLAYFFDTSEAYFALCFLLGIALTIFLHVFIIRFRNIPIHQKGFMVAVSMGFAVLFLTVAFYGLLSRPIQVPISDGNDAAFLTKVVTNIEDGDYTLYYTVRDYKGEIDEGMALVEIILSVEGETSTVAESLKLEGEQWVGGQLDFSVRGEAVTLRLYGGQISGQDLEYDNIRIVSAEGKEVKRLPFTFYRIMPTPLTRQLT